MRRFGEALAETGLEESEVVEEGWCRITQEERRIEPFEIRFLAGSTGVVEVREETVAAALYKTDPWKRFCPGHLFGLRIGKDSD
ncbi:hypothetical protein U1Q18_017005 [Sarracenia purpurea var. burkii]